MLERAGTALREGRVDDLVRAALEAADALPSPGAVTTGEALPPAAARSAPEAHRWLRVGSLLQAAFRFSGAPQLRDRALEVLRVPADRVDDAPTAVTARALMGTVHLLAGTFHSCLDLCDAALDLARAKGIEATRSTALAHQFRGYVLFEWNRLDEAGVALDRAWASAGPDGSGVRSGVARIQAALAAARRDVEGAERWLGEVGTIVSEPMTLRNREWLGAVRARATLGTGDLRHVERWILTAGYSAPEVAAADDAFLLARLHELEGAMALLELTSQWDHALALATAVERVSAGRRRWFHARAASTMGVCLEALGRAGEADAAWTVALDAGHPGSFVRAFIDGDPRRRRSLARLARPPRADPRAQRVLAGAALSEHPVEGESTGVPGLTARQLDVLRLVERGRSNKAISRELELSLSTVKTHLREAFARLGAASRTEAVARARDRGLL